jgi:ABC-type sulfate/molybdate transport systems ATPase subunit
VAAARADRTTLLITHDPVAARAFADEIVYLRAGRREATEPEAPPMFERGK